jgi:hypothetical protein
MYTSKVSLESQRETQEISFFLNCTLWESCYSSQLQLKYHYSVPTHRAHSAYYKTV